MKMIGKIAFLSYSSALKLTGDYFRRLTIAMFSPWFVFVIGNAITITLFLKYSSRNSKTSFDFYEEYVENSLKNQIDHVVEIEYQRRESQCENLKRESSGEERYGGVRRRSAVVVSRCAEKMSGEEFRRTVEDFIARQQRYLREEEFSGIVRY